MLGRGKTRSVHRLVAEAFLGPRPPKCEVLHLNHDPADNRASNLKWGTRGENIAMDYAAGTRTFVNPKRIYWERRRAAALD